MAYKHTTHQYTVICSWHMLFLPACRKTVNRKRDRKTKENKTYTTTAYACTAVLMFGHCVGVVAAFLLLFLCFSTFFVFAHKYIERRSWALAYTRSALFLSFALWQCCGFSAYHQCDQQHHACVWICVRLYVCVSVYSVYHSFIRDIVQDTIIFFLHLDCDRLKLARS